MNGSPAVAQRTAEKALDAARAVEAKHDAHEARCEMQNIDILRRIGGIEEQLRPLADMKNDLGHLLTSLSQWKLGIGGIIAAVVADIISHWVHHVS